MDVWKKTKAGTLRRNIQVDEQALGQPAGMSPEPALADYRQVFCGTVLFDLFLSTGWAFHSVCPLVHSGHGEYAIFSPTDDVTAKVRELNVIRCAEQPARPIWIYIMPGSAELQ